MSIKLIKNNFDNELASKRILRELTILNRMTTVKNNFYTTKLLDVIICSKNQKSLDSAFGIFFVMDYVESDLKKLL